MSKEIKELHAELLAEISEHINHDLGNLPKFKQKLRGSKLTPKDLAEQKTTIDVLNSMGKRGHLAPGNYIFLKESLKDDHEDVITIIEETEEKMKLLKAAAVGMNDRVKETLADKNGTERNAELSSEKGNVGCSSKTEKNMKKRQRSSENNKENEHTKKKAKKEKVESTAFPTVCNYWKIEGSALPFKETCNLHDNDVHQRLGNIRIFKHEKDEKEKRKTTSQGTGFPVGTGLIMSAYHIFEAVIDSKVWLPIAGIIKERLDGGKSMEDFERTLQEYLDIKLEESGKVKKEGLTQEYLSEWRRLAYSGPCRTVNNLIQLFEEKRHKALASELRNFCKDLPDVAEITFGVHKNQQKTSFLDLNVPCYSKLDDFILIRLIGDSRKYPKAFTLKRTFSNNNINMHVVGHVDKQFQYCSCRIRTYDDKKLLENDLKEAKNYLKNRCNSDVNMSYYNSIQNRFNEGRPVFCPSSRSIAHGVAGCPGIVVESGQPTVQIMIQKGHPRKFIDAPLKEKAKQLPEGCLFFGHGLSMFGLYELLSVKETKRIRSDIFSSNS